MLDARYLLPRPARRQRDRDRSWDDVDLLGITLLLFVGPRYYQELFRVRPRSLSQCIRQSGQATFVLHAMKKLQRRKRGPRRSPARRCGDRP